ncbi:cilia- and flagella-associated protein 100-like [Argonauta hians]
MAIDADIFELREKERIIKQEERQQQNNLKVHQKTTYAHTIKSHKRISMKTDADSEECEGKKEGYSPLDGEPTEGIKTEKDDTQFTIAITKDRRMERETIGDYISKKREMFRVQYAIGVMRHEMRKLDDIAKAEERKLEMAEKYLEEDASMFDEFLKENDKSSVEAIKIAEQETKEKLEKVAEIKKINTGIMSLKSEISKADDTLKEYKIYRNFLENLAPQEIELYFTAPQEVLDIFSELEEQNLTLIQNTQETEETLEDIKQSFEANRKKMEKETWSLKDQIEKTKQKIQEEEELANDLEMKVKLFSASGNMQSTDQNQMLEELNKKVEEVYRGIIGSNEANIDTLQMLTNIENRLEELFELEESLPPEKVEAAKKAKEKERRLKMREQKILLQKQHQEERIKKSLERARAEPKKMYGRKLMVRSDPPRLKKEENKEAVGTTREEEEHLYFFTE